MSRFPERLRPAVMPEALKPLGVVTEPSGREVKVAVVGVTSPFNVKHI